MKICVPKIVFSNKQTNKQIVFFWKVVVQISNMIKIPYLHPTTSISLIFHVNPSGKNRKFADGNCRSTQSATPTEQSLPSFWYEILICLIFVSSTEVRCKFKQLSLWILIINQIESDLALIPSKTTFAYLYQFSSFVFQFSIRLIIHLFIACIIYYLLLLHYSLIIKLTTSI